MLKITRTILAIVSFIAVTMLFVDFNATAIEHWPWMAKIQFIPALLSANVVALVILAAMTLIFGRIYCSIICPLGILQDIANWMRGRVGKKSKRKYRFKYVGAHTPLRLVVLTVFAVLLVLGLTLALCANIAGLIEPYSAYGRIATQILAPIANIFNDQTLHVAYVVSVPLLVVAIITLVVVVVMAWRGGRDYCNTICPVGTILGYLSQFSLLKPVIDKSKCIGCTKCARRCKAKCIDARNHAIDYTRCVACMDCINVCQEGAISYTWRRSDNSATPAPQRRHNKPETEPETATEAATDGQPASSSRRSFITVTTGLVAGVALNAAIKTDGGLADLKTKQPVKRATPLVPAGSRSLKHFSQHCTGCQLCVQTCPQGVLRPRTSLEHFMQPVLDFTDGYCDPLCNKCSQACPVGAIEPIKLTDKTAIKIGIAIVEPGACVSATGGSCRSCSSHCPAGAIVMHMVTEETVKAIPSLTIGALMPIVDDEACIGCGICEYHCPVGRVAAFDGQSSAIHVEGVNQHRDI